MLDNSKNTEYYIYS